MAAIDALNDKCQTAQSKLINWSKPAAEIISLTFDLAIDFFSVRFQPKITTNENSSDKTNE